MFARQKSKGPSPEASTGGRLIYAIGDIHGRLDLLRTLLSEIDADLKASKPATKPVLIFVGDYVDRGSSSRGVIDVVLRARRSGRYELRALKGNHEDTLLQFLHDPAIGPIWTTHGGAETLVDYGVSPPPIGAETDIWAAARDAFAARLPPRHLKFLAALETQAAYGDYVFVHAGIRPGVPLSQQTEEDLITIRRAFLSARGPFEKIVVHGHTPAEEPFAGPYRINVDTGAYATGVLTAVRLQDGGQVRFLQAHLEKNSRDGSKRLSRFRARWLEERVVDDGEAN